jgi:hypothetical protein
VYKQAFVALALAFWSSLVLSGVSCGPMCPAGQQSCGNSNPSPANSSDAGGSDASARCGLLSALKKCMSAYCATASNPFCTCYKRGYSIHTGTCKCIAFDEKKFCAEADAAGIDGSLYDCAAESSGVSSYCVPVN